VPADAWPRKDDGEKEALLAWRPAGPSVLPHELPIPKLLSVPVAEKDMQSGPLTDSGRPASESSEKLDSGGRVSLTCATES